jgi:hypothetical protein
MYVAQPQPFSSDVLVSAMDANHLEMVMSSILFLTDCQFGTSAGASPPAGPGAQCEQTGQEPAPMFEGIATPPSGLPTAAPGMERRRRHHLGRIQQLQAALQVGIFSARRGGHAIWKRCQTPYRPEQKKDNQGLEIQQLHHHHYAHASHFLQNTLVRDFGSGPFGAYRYALALMEFDDRCLELINSR